MIILGQRVGEIFKRFFSIWSKDHGAAFELSNSQATHISDYKGNSFLKTGLTALCVKQINGMKCRRSSQKMSAIIEEQELSLAWVLLRLTKPGDALSVHKTEGKTGHYHEEYHSLHEKKKE